MDWLEWVIVIVIVLMLALCVVVVFLPKMRCETLMELNTDYEIHFDWWAGCLVKIEGYWFDTEAVNLQHIRGELDLSPDG